RSGSALCPWRGAFDLLELEGAICETICLARRLCNSVAAASSSLDFVPFLVLTTLRGTHAGPPCISIASPRCWPGRAIRGGQRPGRTLGYLDRHGRASCRLRALQ